MAYEGRRRGLVIYVGAFPRPFPDTYPAAWAAVPRPGPFALQVPAGGAYRTVDGGAQWEPRGETWHVIHGGLPSKYGFPLALQSGGQTSTPASRKGPKCTSWGRLAASGFPVSPLDGSVHR